MSSFSNGGLFSIFVKDITQSESATKKLLKTFYRLTVLITQRKPITPPDDFKRNPAGVVPPLCDITGDLEEVTNAVGECVLWMLRSMLFSPPKTDIVEQS